jgi:hypothetical protein
MRRKTHNQPVLFAPRDRNACAGTSGNKCAAGPILIRSNRLKLLDWRSRNAAGIVVDTEKEIGVGVHNPPNRRFHLVHFQVGCRSERDGHPCLKSERRVDPRDRVAETAEKYAEGKVAQVAGDGLVRRGMTWTGVIVDGAFVAIASLPFRVRVMPVSSAATAVMPASMTSAEQSKEHPSATPHY